MTFNPIGNKEHDSIYLKYIIDNIPHYVFWKDRDSVFLGCNKKFAETAGLASSDDIIGKTDFDLPWGEFEAETYREDDRKVIESGKAKLHIEETQTTDDGKRIVLSTSKIPLSDERGNVIGVLAIYTDITKSKEIEESLRKANDVKSEFIANMSHDLRTPMTGVMGMLTEIGLMVKDVSYALSENPDQVPTLLQQMHQYVGIAQESSQELLTMFNDILELVSLESGKVREGAPEHFSLWGIIKKNHDLLTATAKHKHLDLEMEVAQCVPHYLYGFRRFLDRILVNLLGNALKFTEQGSVTIRADVVSGQNAAVNEEVILRLCVEDTGVGIPADKFDAIFEHFSRLTSSYSGVYKGSGLGLYAVRRYVESMSGSIRVESKVGKGSRFIVELPFIRSDHSDVLGDATDDAKAMPAMTKKPDDTSAALSDKLGSAKAVLLTEDNLAAAMVVGKMLKRFGCRVDHAQSGQEAIDLATKNDYCLVFMDIGLPDMSGLDAARAIRGLNGHRSQVPIVALTGHVNHREECLDAGMQDLLHKPAKADHLAKMLSVHGPSHLEEPHRDLMDWSGCVAKSGGDEAAARSIFRLFLDELASAQEKIDAAMEAHDLDSLEHELHKIRGGVCYLALPDLDKALEAFHLMTKGDPLDPSGLQRCYQEAKEAAERLSQRASEVE